METPYIRLQWDVLQFPFGPYFSRRVFADYLFIYLFDVV